MIRQAVLVATPSERARRRVAGVPLVKRAIIVLSRAAIDEIVVVTEQPLAAELAADPDLAGLSASVTYVDSWAAARSHAEPAFVLLSTDTVFDVAIAKSAAIAASAALEQAHDTAGPASSTGNAALAQTAGASGVVPCVDRRGARTGVYVAGPAIFDADSLASATATAAGAIDAGDALWHSASTDVALAGAEDALFRSLGKRTDGPISRLLNRPISTFVTRRLVRTNVTPNQMTIVANVIGAIGVALVFQATWSTVALGAFLVQMQSILDGCDGEIARLKFKSSKIGEWLDNVLDDQVNIGFGVALGYAGTQMTGQWWWTWVGIGAGSAFMIHNLIFYWQLAFVHRSGNPFHFRWWFEKPGVDVTAMLDKQGAGAKLGFFVRALIRRDVFLFGFFVLAAAGLPQIAAAWYAAVAASQFLLMMVHVAHGGPPKHAPS